MTNINSMEKNCENVSEELDQAMAASQEASTDDTEQACFIYDLQNGKATITGYRGSDEEVYVPESIDGHIVIGIGNEAFKDCKGVRAVALPDCVERFGDAVFSGCSALETVLLPWRVRDRYVRRRMFEDCASLKSMTLPEGITAIESEAFKGCASLETVVLPESVDSYSARVFCGCDSLKNVKLPAGISMVSDAAFEGSPLEAHKADILACMAVDTAFVFEDGENRSESASAKVKLVWDDDAQKLEYALGEGFILNNEDRALRRIFFDPIIRRHIFQDVQSGDIFTVKAIAPDAGLKTASDASVVESLLSPDSGIALPQDRQLAGAIADREGIYYGTCEYRNGDKLQNASIVVCNGGALLILGAVERILPLLKTTVPPMRIVESAVTVEPEPEQAAEPENLSFWERVKRFFGF